MSKYAGSITIVNDDGEAVFERELDQDEIIDMLLESIPDAEEEVAPPPAPRAARQTTVKKDKQERGTPKPCCGSKQNRHKKSCIEAPAGERELMNESQFDKVKELNEKGTSIEAIAEHLMLEKKEVQKAYLASDYAAYSS